ncbi:MAG: DNA adenine methylase [Treponema sp.]|nr:DNA adenine methylase [Treponema sp.]
MAFCDTENERENESYLTTQLITYLGNKRALIHSIEDEIIKIKAKLKKEKCVCADLFSGSGVVSRMMKRHSEILIANDLELYAHIINSCYLSNKNDFNSTEYVHFRKIIDARLCHELRAGIITKNYAPADDTHIQVGERAFYTRANALRIDTYRALIDDVVIDTDMQKYFLAPLITEASVHVNTGGVFKGFYKDKQTGIGSFGGTGKNALARILGEISLCEPVFSNFASNVQLYQEDAVALSPQLCNIDIAYLDPPYNQHPYGSNYFMLNLVVKNKIETPMSNVSGIVSGWNRSEFNSPRTALSSIEKIISTLDAKFIIVSYNSEGFISYNQMKTMLATYGTVDTVEIPYTAFRASRNLHGRTIHLSEYLFIVEKN